jgi:hypothetical protein
MSQPIKRYNIAGVKAAIWENGEFRSVTFSKSYKTASGEWKDTTSFSPRDMGTLAAIALKVAHEELDAPATIPQETPRKPRSTNPVNARQSDEIVPFDDIAGHLADDNVPF